LEQLQQKNIKQLKEIGWQLNVMPEGDKRCRQNWIDALVGLSISRCCNCWNPPQSENIRFRLEADGQLSLLDFEVQSQPERPDPDDFESLDAFGEAIASGDWEHPEELVVSLDSLCE
jgi:hypothetical protein